MIAHLDGSDEFDVWVSAEGACIQHIHKCLSRLKCHLDQWYPSALHGWLVRLCAKLYIWYHLALDLVISADIDSD